MWESRPNPDKKYGKCIITDGTHKLSLEMAYDYIVYKYYAKNGKRLFAFADKHIAMRDLELTQAEYKQFRRVVCEKLCVPDELCEKI